jgi:hypothetical protein
LLIFADDRIDHDPIASQTFLNDPGRHRRAFNALFFTGFAGTLFALGTTTKYSAGLTSSCSLFS